MGILDAPATIKSIPNLNQKIYSKSGLFGQLASNRNCGPSTAQGTAGQIINGINKRTLINGANAIRLVYANIFSGVGIPTGGTNGESIPAAPIFVKAAINYLTGNNPARPVTFAGRPFGLIAPGGLIISDPIGMNGIVGEAFYEQVAASTSLAPIVTATASTTGGSLADATYYFKVTSITEAGESNGSTEVSAVVSGGGGSGSVTLLLGDKNMTFITTQRFNVYASTSTNTEILVASMNGSMRSFTYTGQTFPTVSTTTTAITSATGTVPVVSSAGFRAGDSITINSVAYTIQSIISATSLFVTGAVSQASGVTVALSAVPPATTQQVVGNFPFNTNITGEFSSNGYDMSISRYSGSALNTAATMFGAVAIIAEPLSTIANPKPPVFLFGDSIMWGAGDTRTISEQTLTYTGFGARALADQFPFVDLAVPGETSAQFVLLGGSSVRMTIAQSAKYSICNYGVNDINLGQTVAQTKANILEIAKGMIDMGHKKYYHCTISPWTNSTDAWQTVANQTTRGTFETNRQALNLWLRAPASAGAGNSFLYDIGTTYASFAGVFDTAATVEVNSDGTSITINPSTGAISNGSGGFWQVFGTTHYTTNIGTISGSTTNLIDSGQSMTTNQYGGYNIAYVVAGTTYVETIKSNTATNFSFEAAAAVAPTAGTTYFVYKAYNRGDGLHPSRDGHATMATGIDTTLLV